MDASTVATIWCDIRIVRPVFPLRRKPKVFGIGLSRTGTTSLNSALELLGLRSVHFPCDPRTRREIEGYLSNGGDRLRLSVLRRCDGLTDTPVCATFEALDAAYPGSRFVLTVRDDREAWLRSCELFWARAIDPFLRQQPDDPYAVYIAAIGRALYGSTEFDLQRFSRAYDAYRERVDRHFRGREGDVLVLDLFCGHSWPELCAFLDRPVPEAPFPFENPAAGKAPVPPP
jgi:Sulfotransferase domain